MNKILVSGLAIGNNVGACSVCNFDFEFLQLSIIKEIQTRDE
jgi:hypothetical protein